MFSYPCIHSSRAPTHCACGVPGGGVLAVAPALSLPPHPMVRRADLVPLSLHVVLSDLQPPVQSPCTSSGGPAPATFTDHDCDRPSALGSSVVAFSQFLEHARNFHILSWNAGLAVTTPVCPAGTSRPFLPGSLNPRSGRPADTLSCPLDCEHH